jgi:hypothetical protein
MKAGMCTVKDIFEAGRFEVPAFQRRYARGRNRHWERLAEAIRFRAEARLEGQVPPPLFLGAIILDTFQEGREPPFRREVVDGQHRLTTLQLAIAAARAVSLELEIPETLPQLESLIYDEVDNPRFRSNALDSGLFFDLLRHRTGFQDRHSPATDQAILGCYLHFRHEFHDWLSQRKAEDLRDAGRALQLALANDIRLFVLDLERHWFWKCLYKVVQYSFWPPQSRAVLPASQFDRRKKRTAPSVGPCARPNP